MQITRRDALTGATAAVAVATVPTIVVATTKPEDPVLVLKREWDARWDEYVSETDDSDEVLDPLHDRLGEITYQILQTPATTIMQRGPPAGKSRCNSPQNRSLTPQLGRAHH